MKKILCVLFILMACHAHNMYAQGFLNKIKQKAGMTIDQMVGTNANDRNVDGNQTEKSDDDSQSEGTPTVTDRLPKLRQSTVFWDGDIQPSRASNARGLLAELPALPSVAEIANPTLSARESYYNKLVSIDMRIDELDEQASCSDEELKAMREKLYTELSSKFGLTVDEMKLLEDSNLPESERMRLEQKVNDAILGGADLDDISAKAEKNEARMNQIEVRLDELDKKEQRGTLTAADKQEMANLQQEMMTMSQEMMQGLSGVMNATKQIASSVDVNVVQLEQKLKAFSDKMVAQRKNEQGVLKSCEQIASEYESELGRIYEQIWAESDLTKVDRLYEQADAMMKNYRTRAAQVYLDGLRMRLENTKKLIPEAEKLYADMADENMIPQCIVGRVPLNIVTQCVDIMNEAYTDFPQPNVLPVHKEVIFKLEDDEYMLRSESCFMGNLDDFIDNSKFLISKGNGDTVEYYKIENGRRVKLSGIGPFDFSKEENIERETPQYGEKLSRSGKRKSVYASDGSLTLHDGTTFYPLVVKFSSDKIEFITDGDNELLKCTYKL